MLHVLSNFYRMTLALRDIEILVLRLPSWMRFGFVGGSGLLFALLFYPLIRLFIPGDLGYLLAAILVQLTWLPVAFFLQSKYVFKARSNRARALPVFLAGQLVIALVGIATLSFLVEKVGVSEVIAYYLTICFTVLLSYSTSSQVVFRNWRGSAK